MYALHFEVWRYYKVVERLQIDNWSLTTVFFWNQKEGGVKHPLWWDW